MAKKMIKIMMVPRIKTHLRDRHDRRWLNLKKLEELGQTAHDMALSPPRSLLINIDRQGSTQASFLELPTAGHTVLGDAVATDVQCVLPLHVGVCSCRNPTTGN